MLSHNVPVSTNLSKVRCASCGLVTNAGKLVFDIDSFYEEEYQPAQDHVFFTDGGPRYRAEVFRDWILSVGGRGLWSEIDCCLEVGCGSGDLLARFREIFPHISYAGIEPNQAASARLEDRGFDVESFGSASKRYQLIYSVAVLEHVQEPTEFLKSICSLLTDHGVLVLVIPTQDVLSYDVFFQDHLYHFASKHIRELGRKVGLKEIGLSVGHPLMPNFSMHIFRKCAPTQDYRWDGSPGVTKCKEAASALQVDLQRLNEKLRSLEGRRIAVFGVHEAFTLIRIYSNLWDTELVCGLADGLAATDDLAVFTPEQAPPLDAVLLTLNRVHYPVARRRLEPLDVEIVEIFSEAWNQPVA